MDVLALALLQAELTFIPPTHILLHQHDYTSIRLLKDNDGKYLFTNSGNTKETMTPWGLPVMQTTQQTSGNFTVLPLNQMKLVMAKDWDLLMASENQDDFIKLLATCMVYGRFGLVVYYPGSVILGDFTSAMA